MNSVEDHIHVLFHLHRTKAVSNVVKEIKQSSSKWLKSKANMQGFAWQGGYAVFSVSESKKPAVVRYIQKQKEHHQRTCFQDELRSLLTLNNVSYDEYYVWE